MREVNAQHRTRGRQVLIWAGLLLLLCALSLVLPRSTFDRISHVFGAHKSSVFGEDARALDAALASGAKLPMSADRARALVPEVVARRLTHAGPMTEDQMRAAARTWRKAMTAVIRKPVGDWEAPPFLGARDAIVGQFPRLDSQKVAKELHQLATQLKDAGVSPTAPPKFPGASDPGKSTDCASCHAQTRPLPDGKKFDAVGIYPFMGTDKQFDGGRRIPYLDESLELAARQKRTKKSDDLHGATCTSCHVAHGAPKFAIDKEKRSDNEGLWVDLLPPERKIVHFEVKVQNIAGGHRVPAGIPRAAYVVTAQASQHGHALAVRHGSKLPPHLRGPHGALGMVFARQFVDAAGKVTTDLGKAVDLVADTRLESGRFAHEHFVFDRRGTSPAHIVVTLWYLPDYATWKGAVPIRKAEQTVPYE